MAGPGQSSSGSGTGFEVGSHGLERENAAFLLAPFLTRRRATGRFLFSFTYVGPPSPRRFPQDRRVNLHDRTRPVVSRPITYRRVCQDRSREMRGGGRASGVSSRSAAGGIRLFRSTRHTKCPPPFLPSFLPFFLYHPCLPFPPSLLGFSSVTVRAAFARNCEYRIGFLEEYRASARPRDRDPTHPSLHLSFPVSTPPLYTLLRFHAWPRSTFTRGWLRFLARPDRSSFRPAIPRSKRTSLLARAATCSLRR